MKKHGRTPGMTLIEIIVAMAIFAIVVVAVFPAFIISARLNMVSKATTDSTTYAQQQIESIYAYSTNNSYASTLTALAANYTVSTSGAVSTLTKTDTPNNMNVTLTMTKDSPSTGMVKIKIVVGLINNPQQALPSQIETIMIFR